MSWFKYRNISKLEHDLEIEDEKKKRLLKIIPEINELFNNFCDWVKNIKYLYTNDEPQIWVKVQMTYLKLKDILIANKHLIEKKFFRKINNFVDVYFRLAFSYVLSRKKIGLFSKAHQKRMINAIDNKHNKKIDKIKNDLRKINEILMS